MNSGFQADAELHICNQAKVSNAPIHINRKIISYKPHIVVGRVVLLTAPMKGGCLSSGYGLRHQGERIKKHNGLDYVRRPAGKIYAASRGRVIELTNRRDFGNMLVIDHGSGVFTRYAHLASFQPNLQLGAVVSMGDELGMMGSTGRSTGVHLHYEILTGIYKGSSFSLRANDPFKFSAPPG